MVDHDDYDAEEMILGYDQKTFALTHRNASDVHFHSSYHHPHPHPHSHSHSHSHHHLHPHHLHHHSHPDLHLDQPEHQLDSFHFKPNRRRK